jgi:hypothetical protein
VSSDKARLAFCEYILSDDYRRLLTRALLSRLSTSSAHKSEHMRALDLLRAAFPEDCI